MPAGVRRQETRHLPRKQRQPRRRFPLPRLSLPAPVRLRDNGGNWTPGSPGIPVHEPYPLPAPMPSAMPAGRRLAPSFFDRDAQEVAADLLGKVLCRRLGRLWLMVAIVEAEAYYRADRASHASLGPSPSRRSLFMPSGTIYMYYSRGGDSFNVSCRGRGDAVLVKAGLPLPDAPSSGPMLSAMRLNNPLPSGASRPLHRLCSGQTLLCRSLGLKVPEWDGRPVRSSNLFFLDVGYRPARIVRAERLGIPQGRDGHLPYRFVDHGRAHAATRNPLTQRNGPATQVLDYPLPGRQWADALPTLHGAPPSIVRPTVAPGRMKMLRKGRPKDRRP